MRDAKSFFGCRSVCGGAGLLAGLLCLVACPQAGATIQNYTPDAASLHLWHFDELAPPCVDSVVGGTNLAYMINGAVLGNTSFTGGVPGFTNCISFGALDTPGAVIFPAGSGNVGAVIPFAYAGA